MLHDRSNLKPTSPRSGVRLLAWAIAGATAFMLAGFGVLAALGYADDERFRSLLVALESEHGRFVVGCVLVLLLALDLLLPLPSSVLLMLAGHWFGTVPGGAIGLAGSTASAWIGFVLCRRYGLPAFRRICGETETVRVSESLAGLSPWLVLATRGAPMLAELAACLAGLAAWPLRKFLLCVVVGTAPVAFVYAAAGAHAREASIPALLVGVLLPIAGFALGLAVLRRRKRPHAPRHPLERNRSLD